ncbi:MAG TPA: hypothetical protein VND93_18625, partial [Myxococcales bacterium]|nr:hypothetical protein [Myxococcales bacterium]
GRQGRGGLDLSGRGHGGGAPGSDAQAQSQSQRQPQQPQARANQADAARDSGGSPRARPADVTEFPKGQPPRQRVKQEPRDNDEQQRRRLQAERARQQQEDGQRQPEDKDRKPAPKQQKPSGGGGGPAPKLKLGSAFKLKNVNGKMEMVKQTFSERKAEAPQGSQDDGGSAKMMAALSQKM